MSTHSVGDHVDRPAGAREAQPSNQDGAYQAFLRSLVLERNAPPPPPWRNAVRDYGSELEDQRRFRRARPVHRGVHGDDGPAPGAAVGRSA
jgi:hypothetical protein